MDARVISAFTRVFDALLPAHDELRTSANITPSCTIAFPFRRAFARGVIHFASLTPNRGVGGAPIRHPHLLTLPQVAPGHFKVITLLPCVALTPPLPSSGYIASNLDRAWGGSCVPGISFPRPSYEAFVVRAATPMAATSTCRLPTAAKAGSSGISVMAASTTWV